MWCEKKPNIGHLPVFGCVAYAYVPDCERQKLDKKARKLRFVGYCKTSKGYRLYDEDTRRIFKSRDVIFNETDFAVKTPMAKKRKKEEVLDIEPESCPVEESPCQLNEWRMVHNGWVNQVIHKEIGGHLVDMGLMNLLELGLMKSLI